MRDGRLKRVEAIIERQQRMLAEGDDERLFLGGEDGRARRLRPHRRVMDEGRASATSATVFGLRPWRAASSLIEAFDRCIAARTACVVVALP